MKIVIIIEDTNEGVDITAAPGQSEILQMPTEHVTSAGAYALAALTAIDRLSLSCQEG